MSEKKVDVDCVIFFYQNGKCGDNYGGPPRGKRDGVIRHILERENVNWIKKCVIS